MGTPKCFRCGICWKDRPLDEYSYAIRADIRLPICRACDCGIRSGLPAEIHMMTLGLTEAAAVARASILRTLLFGAPLPEAAGSRNARYEVLQYAIERLQAELHYVISEAKEAEDDGDVEATEQSGESIQHTKWLLSVAELMLQSTRLDIGDAGGEEPFGTAGTLDTETASILNGESTEREENRRGRGQRLD